MKQYIVTFLAANHRTHDSVRVEAYNNIVACEYFQHLHPEVDITEVMLATDATTPDYKFPSITKEMIKKIRTDSDLEDLAYELDVSVMTLGFIFCNEAYRDTECYGCKNIMMKGMYPCNSCSRGRTDNYVETI